MNLKRKLFRELDLHDPFFDSLKEDYIEFVRWFESKANEPAYISEDDNGKPNGFLYLKLETGSLPEITPALPSARRLKVGTFKIEAHGTRLGERFVKKIFDHAIGESVDQIYMTVFPKYSGLINLISKYGFKKRAEKLTHNGVEDVCVRVLFDSYQDNLTSYPLVRPREHHVFLLSLYPKWHTRLLPDSKLHTEAPNIVEDISHTNSIHKVYLCAMQGIENLKEGDLLVIYRTSDSRAPAHYRSVVTSICVLEEYRRITSFESVEDFLRYCLPYSVFTEDELRGFWLTKSYPHVIRFTYNIALPKRLTRKVLIEDYGMDASAYWGFLPLTLEQFAKIAEGGCINESLVIH